MIILQFLNDSSCKKYGLDNYIIDTLTNYKIDKTSAVKSICVPGIYLVKFNNIINGLMNENYPYTYLYIDDIFTKYIPHEGTLIVSYFQHDCDHQQVIVKLIFDNIQKHIEIVELWKEYKNRKGSFICRIIEIFIFMRYFESFNNFNGDNFIESSFLFQDLINSNNEESQDFQQIFKYITKSYDISIELKTYILNRLFVEVYIEGE